MTIRERAELYNEEFGRNNAASRLHVVQEQDRDVLYGRWVLGQDYRNKSAYYGAYPPDYLHRVFTLFPDAFWTGQRHVLHACSGSLPPDDYSVRLDIRKECAPDVVGSVYDADKLLQREFFLTLVDIPYSADDATKYSTPSVNRGKAMAALAAVTSHWLVWLDTTWPMHSKRQWVTVGRIAVTRSTNHRIRDVSIFQRVR